MGFTFAPNEILSMSSPDPFPPNSLEAFAKTAEAGSGYHEETRKSRPAREFFQHLGDDDLARRRGISPVNSLR